MRRLLPLLALLAACSGVPEVRVPPPPYETPTGPVLYGWKNLPYPHAAASKMVGGRCVVFLDPVRWRELGLALHLVIAHEAAHCAGIQEQGAADCEAIRRQVGNRSLPAGALVSWIDWLTIYANGHRAFNIDECERKFRGQDAD